MEQERIKQNNKFEEDEKIIINDGEIKKQKIELDKQLKLTKQENEKQRKEMILDFFDQVFQAKQILNYQNQN